MRPILIFLLGINAAAAGFLQPLEMLRGMLIVGIPIVALCVVPVVFLLGGLQARAMCIAGGGMVIFHSASYFVGAATAQGQWGPVAFALASMASAYFAFIRGLRQT